MINPEAAKQDSLVAEPDVADEPRVNWTVAGTANPGEGPTQPAEQHASFDQLLQVCLYTMVHEMQVPLDIMLQTIDQLAESELETMPEAQLKALSTLQRQVQALEHIIDGLTYISAVSGKK